MTNIAPDLWDMVVESPRIAAVSRAGHFVHARVADGYLPFLRRPLSIGPVGNGRLRLIFQIRGEGTRLLARRQAGETIDLIGPLGSTFPDPMPGEHPILLGGGIGAVPLMLLDDQIPTELRRTFLVGARSRSILSITEAEASTRNVRWATDDGTLGFHGNSVALLEQVISHVAGTPVVYSCGPGPMLRAMKRLCTERGVKAYASLEVPMGCGVGACQSCAVKKSDGSGYLLVCKDGPVFDARDVVLEGELH